ncbi:MAG: SWIM zinc finger family protein [Candidatus Rokubacteria bacterium]|nr:SWIM zinc finger family protein [Candidatus Rokubacteria bacterium]
MAWYGYGGWDYRPYVSVATRRALAAKALAKLARKTGRAAEPIVVSNRRRQIAATFWGKAWCDNLERYADFTNRLPRGRTYVRNGSVVDLTIGRGKIEARVAGSELYEVTIGIAPTAKARWRRVVARCTGKIGSLVGLLRGELSGDVMAVLVDAKEGLFPEPRAMTFECSCPDWAGMCKHVAAVLYGVGVRLDEKPALFFTLRQVDETELLTSATLGAVSRTRTGGGKRIAADKLGDVFGIEIEEAPLAFANRAPTRAESARQAASRRTAAGRSTQIRRR